MMKKNRNKVLVFQKIKRRLKKYYAWAYGVTKIKLMQKKIISHCQRKIEGVYNRTM